MISARSCLQKCRIFFHPKNPFKTHTPHPLFSSISHSSSSSLLCLTIMGMGMATQTQFHVLAVDDSLIDRKLIEKLLKTSSFRVTAVDSGAKALEFLGLTDENIEDEDLSCSSSSSDDSVVVNLIITDYCMPGMSGYDLLRKIKQSEEFKDIPVVIMSSENIPARINRCLEDGADVFFLKPVQLSDVNKLRPHLMKGIPAESDEMRSTVTKEREWKKFSPMIQQEKDTGTWKLSDLKICYFPRKILWVFSLFLLFGVWIGKGG